jgi:hypothetical protein
MQLFIQNHSGSDLSSTVHMFKHPSEMTVNMNSEVSILIEKRLESPIEMGKPVFTQLN